VFDLGEAEDIVTFATHLPTLAAGGARIGIQWIHEKLRIPMAEDGEEIFGGQGSGVRDQESEAAALKATPLPPLTRGGLGRGLLKANADRLAADTAPAMENWLGKIEAMLETADSLEEFREMLAAAYTELDTDIMSAPLATALTAMALAGKVDVESEDR
jgi:phage gp29-like protein